MPRLRYRSGGSWADSALSGAVDFNGGRLAFGPPESPGAIDEFLVMPLPLSNADWQDFGAHVGTRFAISEAGSWIGNRFYRPATAQNPGVEQVFAGNADNGAIIAPLTPIASEVRGAFVEQLFSAPVDIIPGVNYTAAYRCDRYGFSRVTDGATLPLVSASGRVYTDPDLMSAVAVYTYAANTVPGSSSPDFHFNVSPIVRFS